MSDGLLRLALLIALAGGVALLLGPFTAALELIGLGAVALGIVLSAPAARGDEGDWWRWLVGGEGLAGIGVVVSLVSDTLGGLLILLGALAVIVTAALTLPERG